MTCYVLTRLPGGGARVSYFDTQQLDPLGPELTLASQEPVKLDWGRMNEGSYQTAWLLCEREGVPAELLSEVAAAFQRGFVAKLDRESQCIPAWLVSQEVVRLSVRAMSDYYHQS